MFSNWLDSSNVTPDNQTFIKDYHQDPASLTDAKIAFVGINAQKADLIRAQLFDLATIPLPIVDIGNLKNENPAFAIQLMGVLLNTNILPVLFGGDEQFIASLYHAFQLNQKMVNLALIDRCIRFNAKINDKEAYLNPILNPPHANLFHLSILGTQAHLNSGSVYQVLRDNDFDLVGLGAIHANIGQCEPFIRDADLFSFNISTVKHADSPGQKDPFPTGISAQEACTLARFAGLSDKLMAFGLFGYHPDNDALNITAKLSAMIIWYFLDGFANRQGEFPISHSGLKKYIVFNKQSDIQVAFWKSEKTGRWWMEIPIAKANKPTRHTLLPCTYDDYLLATKNQLPDRLLNGLSRIG